MDLIALVKSVSIAAEPVRVALALRAADRGSNALDIQSDQSIPKRPKRPQNRQQTYAVRGGR